VLTLTSEEREALDRIGQSLIHVGNAVRECFKHAGMGSKEPMQPLDHCLAQEARILRGEGLEPIADALVDLRARFEEQTNG
jgi:hypothetical protein